MSSEEGFDRDGSRRAVRLADHVLDVEPRSDERCPDELERRRRENAMVERRAVRLTDEATHLLTLAFEPTSAVRDPVRAAVRDLPEEDLRDVLLALLRRLQSVRGASRLREDR